MSTQGPGGADWDDIYVGDGTDTEPFDHQLLADALELPPGRALDLGCGAGGNVIGLARRGWAATGVDSSSKAIRSARISAAAANPPASFLVADMTIWQPDGLYDLVINCFALPPRGNARGTLLVAARKALAPGGLLIVGEWDIEGASGGDPDHFATLAELTAALAGLEIIRSESVHADPHHPGPTDEEDLSWRAVIVAARNP